MSDESTEPKSPLAKRGFLFAAIGVGAIGLAAVVAITAAITGGGGDPTPAPTPEPTTPAISAQDQSVCGLPGFDTEGTLTAAPVTDWELVGTVAAPTDPKGAGPGEVDDDGFRSCYAHTPPGALYAAANFVALGTDATLGPRLIELVAEGPGKGRVERQSTGGSSGDRAQIAGFRIGSYTGNAATVDLVLNYSSGTLVSLPLKLTWEAGDWKLVLADDGSLPLSPAQLENLGGYIPWAGA